MEAGHEEAPHNIIPAANTGGGIGRIRNARPEDAAAIAEILAEAFPGLYRSTFGRLTLVDTAALLTALYKAGHLSWIDTRVYEQEDHVTGLMILHTGHSIGRGLAADYWRLLRQRLGFWRAPRAFLGGLAANLMLDKRIPRAPDLVYIEALAVAASARGQGIGTQLLADAEQWARSRKRSRLALHVLASNTDARRLYERVGFLPWADAWKSTARPSAVARPAAWAAILMLRTLPD